MKARTAPAIGALLDGPASTRRVGPYRLIRQLGRGGFAPVWLADEVYGDDVLRTAAVKLFALDRPHGRPGERAGGSSERARDRQRVLDEARALCQVEHPNIARFFGLAIDEARGVVGLAMEHVAGESLDQRFDPHARLPLAEALAAGAAVASALTAVHRAGLVHRDVKPANVVFAGGAFKLIDFGIASALGAATRPRAASAPRTVVLDDLPLELVGSRMSELAPPEASSDPTRSSAEGSGGVVTTGTVGYIDPACVRGEPATAASDLYGLGALLYECLTGRLPAAAATEGRGLSGEVLDGRASPPAVRSLAEDVPTGVAAVVDALLDPDPARRPRSAEIVAVELEQALREQAGHARELPPEEVGPFRGLGRYEAADRDVFFGRSAEVAAALELCRSRGLVALVGPSGSGKSSLARAGVLPAIALGHLGRVPERWDTVVVSPGPDPRAAIVAALDPLLGGAPPRDPDAVAATLLGRAGSTGRGLVLLVDQLEELATLSSDEGRVFTARLLSKLAERPVAGLRVLVAGRRDLLDSLLAIPGLGRALERNLMLVNPMSEAAWGDVLDAALGAYGYGFEDEALRAEVLAALRGSESAMPLMQFALARVWEQRDVATKRIDRKGVDAIGGIAGALERHADAVFEGLAEIDPQCLDLGREILLGLTTAQGTRATQRPDPSLFPPGSRRQRTLARLEDARLVVREQGGLTLAHEALLTRWSRLRGWLAELREDRLFTEEIELAARTWTANGRDETLLWRKRRLATADELRRRRAGLSEGAIAFVAAGRRAERRARVVVGAAVVVATALTAIAGAVYVSRIRGERANTEREFRESEKNLALATRNAQEAAANLAKAEANAQAARDAQAEATRLKEGFRLDLEQLQDRVGKAKSAKELEAIQRDVAARQGGGAATAATAPKRPTAVVSPAVGEPP